MSRVLALVLVAAIVACSTPQPVRQRESDAPSAVPTQLDIPVVFASRYAAAEAAVTLFHVRFDQRNFSRIYAMADDTFRAATKEADLIARLGALRDRVGMSKDENEVSVDITDRSPDVLITLVMETTFENATLTETFVWRVTPTEMPFLVRYDTR